MKYPMPSSTETMSTKAQAIYDGYQFAKMESGSYVVTHKDDCWGHYVNSVSQAMKYINYCKEREHLGDVPVSDYTNDGEIGIISYCDFVTFTYGVGYQNHPDYDTQCKDLKEWCKEYKVHYYGRPNEDFFMSEAIKEARTNGLEYVIVDNLS